MATPCSSEKVADQFLAMDWTPLVSVDQNLAFNGSSSSILEEQFPSSSAFIDDHSSFDALKSSRIERNLKGKKRKSISDCGALHLHSSMDKIQADDEHQKSVQLEAAKAPVESREIAHNPIANMKEDSHDGSAPKDDYIHVRAKRGQATNSHSLAERVRREKISERMRLLQDLVPGCNKITGKALMLDEIINYVQSLQRQVEFLSMKLAAVNPELNFDIDQILPKDMLHSRDGNLVPFEFSHGMSIFHPQFHGSSPQGIMQPTIAMPSVQNSGDLMRSTIPQLPSVWDDELQTVLQMGFIPNSSLSGPMKMEL